MRLGTTSLSVTTAGRPRQKAAGGGGDGSVVFDLTGGSLPAGMYQYTGSNAQPTLTWDSTGAKFTGDAGSGQYPLRLPLAFTGDYLFQLSTRIDQDPGGTNWCSDASVAVFNSTYTSTSGWNWKWNTQSGRISAQNNCSQPYLYGENAQQGMSTPNSVLQPPYVSDGTWVTMHFYHEPSLSRTRYKVTVGDKDWEATGTQLGTSPNGGVLQIANSFSGTYYVGISGDDDSNSMYANAFRYKPL